MNCWETRQDQTTRESTSWTLIPTIRTSMKLKSTRTPAVGTCPISSCLMIRKNPVSMKKTALIAHSISSKSPTAALLRMCTLEPMCGKTERTAGIIKTVQQQSQCIALNTRSSAKTVEILPSLTLNMAQDGFQSLVLEQAKRNNLLSPLTGTETTS